VLPEGISPQSVQLMMLPAGQDAGANMAGIELLATQRVTVGADGRFRYTAVAPGQYTLTARAMKGVGPPPPPPPAGAATQVFTGRIAVGGGGGEAPMIVMPDRMGGNADPNAVPYWANVDVTVDGAAIDGVTLSLQPGMSVSGRVEFRSGAVRAGAAFSSVQLNLIPVQTGGGPVISLGGNPLQVDDKGNFTLRGVVPGRYRLAGSVRPAPGSGPGPAWRIGSAIIKDQDVLDFPVEVKPNENITGALVTFVDFEQTVTGALQDASGRPAPDYTIVLFPADQRYWQPGSRRVRSARPSTDGRYSIRNLPAGEYRMVAVTDVLPAELSDPAFLEQLVSASFPLTIAVGENKTQDLKISGGL
jgi:hypothetical protein